MKKPYDKDRVAELAEKILYHKRLYYRGHPEISDAEYDRLEDELRELAPDHPALAVVGAEPEGEGNKVPHDVPMLSLQKTYSEAELARWVDGRAVVGTLKVDGNSLSVIYRAGKFALAKTRGNGRVGEDVTAKARWVPDLPPELPIDHDVEIRGELYCTESQFVRLAHEMAERGLEKPTSPRNIVAGLLGRKSHLELARYFNFFAFEVLDPTGTLQFETEMERFAWLEKMGFRLPHPKLLGGVQDLDAYLAFVRKMMEEDETGIDGAVFSYDDLELHRSLGVTSHHPRYKMSFKWQGQTAISTVREVTWATSRHGIVTPVAVIEPVHLSGANITNITLHNAAHVREYNIKEGDKIELVRSGEVIPKFLQVIESAQGSYNWPEVCPSCGTRLEFDDVRLRCPNNLGCPAQQAGAILNWIRCAEIDDLSEKRLMPLLEKGLVRHMADLYRLRKEDFFVIPSTKDRMASKLYNNIQASRVMPLAQFLNGLGIPGAGRATWEKLLERFPTLEAIENATVEEVQAVEGFAEKSARQIVEGLAARREDIRRLLDAGVVPKAPAPVAAASGDLPLSGKTIVITGALSRPRSEIEDTIRRAGGKTASAVSKNTDAVVTGDPTSDSTKMRKARELGIPVWSEADLERALGGENPG